MPRIEDLAREYSLPSRTLKKVPWQQKVIEVSPITRRAIELDIKPLRFLHYLKLYFNDIEMNGMSYEQGVERAAIEAGVTKEWALGYLESSKYKVWVADRLEEVAIREGVTVEYLMTKHKANVEGEQKLTISQLQSLAELGERIWPKTQRIEHQVEARDNRGMEEMMKVREDVVALEMKLREAMKNEGTA